MVNNRFINKIVCSSKFKSDNGIHIVLIDFKSSNNIVGLLVVYNSVAILRFLKMKTLLRNAV